MICCLMMLVAGQASAIGMEDGVYQIATAQDLDEFIRLVNEEGDSTACALLTADIDFSGHTGMVGCKEHPYQGCFDGACHKITIDYDSDERDMALFRKVDEGCEIKNLHVTGSITCHQQYAAGIVADMRRAAVSNCLATVNITSDHSGDCTYGGISGFTCGGTIRNCVYAGAINAPLGERVAGLVGWVDEPGTVIENCLAICSAELGSGERSNSVVRYHDRNYVTLHNVYYVNEINASVDGAQKVTMDELQNGHIFYRIMSNELYSAEQQIAQQEHELRQTRIRYVLSAAVAVLLTLLLLLLIIITRIRQRQVSLLIQKLKAEHALWQEQQNRMLLEYETPEQTAPETEDAEAEEVAEDEEEDTQAPETDEAPVPAEGKESDVELKAFYQTVQKIMAEKKPYTDPRMDIRRLALEVRTNRTSLSRCINRMSGYKNFNTWLESYRVNHAISMIDENPELSMDEVAAVSGFASRSTFYRHFRDITGLTPRQYQKNRTAN